MTSSYRALTALARFGFIGLSWLAGVSCGGSARSDSSGRGGATTSAGASASASPGGSAGATSDAGGATSDAGGATSDAGDAPTNAGSSSQAAAAGTNGGCPELGIVLPAPCHSDADCQGFCGPELCGPTLVCENGAWLPGGP